MDNRTPPLNALKVFEAAARLKSFKKAAEELHVTPTAVSHRLSQLEEMLGMQLFVRDRQGIALTSAARACLPTLQRGLEHMRDFVEQLRLHTPREVITVKTTTSFSMRWLMPRLHRFTLANPGIDVYVDTCARWFLGMDSRDARETTIRGNAEDADITVVYGLDHVPGVVTERLLDVAVTPLCSPALLACRPALTSPQQLAFFPLLHCDRHAIYDQRSFWTIWLEAAGALNIRTDRSPRFTQASQAIEAAVDGLGMVVCDPVLAAAELTAGKLVAPFDLRVTLDTGYQIVVSEQSNARNAVAVFKAWLHAEAGRGRGQAGADGDRPSSAMHSDGVQANVQV